MKGLQAVSASMGARMARPGALRGLTVGGFVVACTFLLSVGAPGRALADKNLTITIVGGGSVAVNDTTDATENTTCTTSPCVVQLDNNDVGTLTATPDSGWVFSGWSDQSGGITGCSDNQCNFSMGNSAQSVTATFTQLTSTVTQTATGTATPSRTASPSQTASSTRTTSPTGTVTPTGSASRTTTTTTTPAPEAGHCSDNIDNDHNGFTDCADPACVSDPLCAKGQHQAPAMTPPWLMLTALALFVLAVVVLTRKRLRE
jgi:hypothetical protein